MRNILIMLALASSLTFFGLPDNDIVVEEQKGYIILEEVYDDLCVWFLVMDYSGDIEWMYEGGCTI